MRHGAYAARFATALLTALLLPCVACAQDVHQPHASLFDVLARQRQLTSHPNMVGSILSKRVCVLEAPVPAPVGRIVIPRHYLHDSNGPINPAEAASTRPYQLFEDRVDSGTQQWLATDSTAEAGCALDQLETWARAGALLDYDRRESSQAWFQVEWTLASIAISESVLVNDAKLPAAEVAEVNAWLDRVAHKLMDGDKPHGNNHHYWRGMAATATGVLTHDDGLFRAGIDAYNDGLDEMDARGALPQEMARHENAIHYQGFALQPLIMIAAFAQRQGEDLFARERHGHTLRDAIVFFGNAVADPAVVKPYTDDAQKTGFKPRDFAAEAIFIGIAGPAGLPQDVIDGAAEHTWDNQLGGDLLLYAGHEWMPRDGRRLMTDATS